MFGSMSINPWVNQVVRPFIALAPVMSLSHISAPLRALARLPVRIRVPDSVAKQGLLRAGMSVYTTVDTSEGAADADADTDLDSPMMIHPQ